MSIQSSLLRKHEHPVPSFGDWAVRTSTVVKAHVCVPDLKQIPSMNDEERRSVEDPEMSLDSVRTMRLQVLQARTFPQIALQWSIERTMNAVHTFGHSIPLRSIFKPITIRGVLWNLEALDFVSRMRLGVFMENFKAFKDIRLVLDSEYISIFRKIVNERNNVARTA